MEILYFASTFNDALFQSLFEADCKPPHAANKYHQLLMEGIAENGVSIRAYSTLPVNRQNCRRRFVHPRGNDAEKLHLRYLPIINLPIAKHLLLLAGGFFASLPGGKNKVVIFDGLTLSASIGAVCAAKLTGKKTVAIVTDLPEYMPIGQSSRGLKLNNALIAGADGRILLTQQMTDIFPGEHIVLEGHVDSHAAEFVHLPPQKIRKVIYAGSLFQKYGIRSLCEAFLQVYREGEELHIYGSGDFEDQLLILAQENPAIHFHGNCPNREVVTAELDAALLVNPRSARDEYTKYSFPSKTLEYLSTGTPVLMADLPGMPEEYRQHVFLFSEERPNGLAEKLREVLDLPQETLSAVGQEGKAFVLREKSNTAQARKILEWSAALFQ